MPNVVFRPRVSERAPSKTFFAELCTAPGPNVIGETGDNTFDTLFGREWLLEWSVEDDTLRLYQESVTHPGEWERVTSPLPPVFDGALPATARRVSFAFDQSARMIVAIEDEGVVKVTRWDPGLSQYIQNVSFAGVDPAVVMDATWAYDIPNSDVLIFYLSTDRTRVMCRVQRELYAVEHEMWDYGQAVILDRALPAFLRYQLLVADSAGAPLEKVLLSDPYPYLAGDHQTGIAWPPVSGELVLAILSAVDSGALTAAAVASVGGVYADPIITAGTAEEMGATAAVTTSGDYIDTVISKHDGGEVTGSASTLTAGDYELVVLTSSRAEAIAAAAIPPAGGTYA